MGLARTDLLLTEIVMEGTHEETDSDLSISIIESRERQRDRM
jgi:hypothetical protein